MYHVSYQLSCGVEICLILVALVSIDPGPAGTWIMLLGVAIKALCILMSVAEAHIPGAFRS